MKSEILSEDTIKELDKKGWTLINEEHTVNPRQEIVNKVPMFEGDKYYFTTIIPYHEILNLKFIKVKE